MASIIKRGTKYYIKHQPQVGRQFQRLLKGVINNRQARQELARVERELTAGRDPFPPDTEAPKTVGDLMEQWSASLTNRSADGDQGRIRRDLVPYWKKYTVDEVTLPKVLEWIDVLAATELSAQSQRHALNTLSRFFSWCIERQHAAFNPVLMVPRGLRPSPVIDRDQPWLEDDTLVPAIMKELGGDIALAFYLANRSGMRSGEVCGLRLGDLDFLKDGVIRVAHSYNGPLKEDEVGDKVKWVPAPADAADVLKLHLHRRRLAGAKAEDLVFPWKGARTRKNDWTGYIDSDLAVAFRKVRTALGLGEMTWYQATRHSFVSRNLKNGVSLDEVSAAVGHSSPIVTKRFYAHYVRKEFSAEMRKGLAAS